MCRCRYKGWFEFTDVNLGAALGIALLTKQSSLSILKCLFENRVVVIYIYLKLPHKKYMVFFIPSEYFIQSLFYAKFLAEKEIWLKTQFFHSVACISFFIKSHQFEVFEGLFRFGLPFGVKVFIQIRQLWKLASTSHHISPLFSRKFSISTSFTNHPLDYPEPLRPCFLWNQRQNTTGRFFF